MKNYMLILAFCVSIMLSGCNDEFVPVNYGHEACTHCKMTIMDKRFAAEILTGKGKAYKFDDLGCLLKYMKDEQFHDTDAKIFVADFNNPDGKFIDARHAVFIHSESLRSPMNGNLAASTSAASANALNATLHSNLLTWKDLEGK